MSLKLSYEEYVDRIYGGWFGKSLGGMIGAPWKGETGHVEFDESQLIPAKIPPNDDLDFPVMWLSVLEQKGPWLRSTDLADAWMEYCWYPWAAYGMFRKNYRLGLQPPFTGQVDNEAWGSGIAAVTRSEIWGYVAPGNPMLAADYAMKDGTLDHADQSAGAEQMFAAMAADAFSEKHVRNIVEKHLHFLPKDSAIRLTTEAAIRAFDKNLTLEEARQRVLLLGGTPEATDAIVNVPFTVLGLLYGKGDLWQTLLACLKLGYDTDSTCATAGALVGQVLGYKAIPAPLRETIRDTVVAGIMLQRDEMLITSLARDTARMGVWISQTRNNQVQFTNLPAFPPWPSSARTVDTPAVSVEYPDGPVIAPGETKVVRVHVAASAMARDSVSLRLDVPEGLKADPAQLNLSRGMPVVDFKITAVRTLPAWPRSFRCRALVEGGETASFALLGAAVWQVMAVGWDPPQRWGRQFVVSMDQKLLPDEGNAEARQAWNSMAKLLDRDPVIFGRTYDVPVQQLIPMRAEFGALLYRELLSPSEQKVQFWVGCSDAFRLYLNGKPIGEKAESGLWHPWGEAIPASLREGVNRLILKVLRRSEGFRCSVHIRGERGHDGDHVIDLADGLPAAWKG